MKLSLPTRERELKSSCATHKPKISLSLPTRERELKSVNQPYWKRNSWRSLPTRERELKYPLLYQELHLSLVAPHTGAWIEINTPPFFLDILKVAPHTGAWIEI